MKSTDETLSPAAQPLSEDPRFRLRRTQNWVALGLLYAFFYMTRYNFAAVMGGVGDPFGWTNTQLGVFETVMPLVYGLSVVLNGPIADRVGGRKAFLFGAVGVVIANFLFGLGTLLVLTPAVMEGSGHHAHLITPAVLRFGLSPTACLAMMATVWGINGYFQSFGALSIVKVNAQWFHVRERGTFAGVFGVMIRFGLILSFSGVPLILTLLPVRWAFWLPGACVAAMFVANAFLMKDSPKAAGFGDYDTGDEGSTDDKPPSLGYVLKKVFASKVTWIIALASMMIGMVRRSTVDVWFSRYFEKVYLPHDLPTARIQAAKAAFMPYQTAAWGIAILGILGGFAFGIASDRKFQSRRAPVITFGFIGMAVILVLFGLSDRLHLGPWPAALFLALLSFFVNGAHGMIGGAASMDFGGRKAAATAAGLFDGMQYLASSMVGIGMGYLLDHWGWAAWQWAPIPFAIAGALLISRLWNVTPRKSAGH